MIKIGIVGGTGYTGVELLRLLARHPKAELLMITSRAEAGTRVDALFTNLRGSVDLEFSAPDNDALRRCDVVFFATPHGVAQSMAKPLFDAGVRIIDLSADFRIKNIPLWEQWYGQAHACPDLVDNAIYGLPELNRDRIKGAQLIACPGCYPTAAQLALAPLLEAAWIDPEDIIINAASGISGAGRAAKMGLLMAENFDNFKAYAAAGHRHLPEIEQGLRALQAESDPAARVTFVPHLLPMIRGIHETIYVRLNDAAGDVQALYQGRYAAEPFVDVLPRGVYPETRSVRGTNRCQISLETTGQGRRLVLMAAIDNLARGASAQAIQNMNLMFELPENLGLDQVAVMP